MKNLTKYVANCNSMAAIFARDGVVPLVLDAKNLSPEWVETLKEQVEGDLSPENLTCDGELHGAKVRAKAKYLNGVAAELAGYKATA